MQEFALNVPGFEGRGLKMAGGGMFSSIKFFIDGQRVPFKKFKLMVTDNSGKEVEIKPSHGFLVDPGTSVTVGQTTVKVREPLKWYEYAWAGWPILLLFVGGAIGGFAGGLAAGGNVMIFRSKTHPAIKYFLTFIIGVFAFLFWAVLATIIRGALGR